MKTQDSKPIKLLLVCLLCIGLVTGLVYLIQILTT
jgi:hypothetical protein